MASVSADTYFARPVFVKQDNKQAGTARSAAQGGRDHGKANVSKIPVPNTYKKSLSLDRKPRAVSASYTSVNGDRNLPDMSPPPRPPPPRPPRAAKRQETMPERDPHHPGQTTPEPKPQAKLNVTRNDGIWRKDSENDPRRGDNGLSIPMRHITPETAEEMWRNFDPLDALDSASDKSDASVDTMIMMTTEEEKKNEERITSSLKQYKTVKFKDIPNTNKLKLNMQNGKTRDMHLGTDMNGADMLEYDPGTPPRMVMANRVVPLHVATDHDNGSSPEGSSNKTSNSPNDDSPDDGYGTNSSSGTVSSPFSSSFNSVITDFDNSYNGGALVKSPLLPNGAIKPNSVRESWAVKRKQRMIEAQDNSLQEQLRQLTIIEEEGGAGLAASSENPENLHRNLNLSHHNRNKLGINVIRHSGNGQRSNVHPANRTDSGYSATLPTRVARGVVTPPTSAGMEDDPPYVNVSQSEIAQRNRQLYVKTSENDGNTTHEQHGKANNNQWAIPVNSPANEINALPAGSSHDTRASDIVAPVRGAREEPLYDQVYEPAPSVRPINRPVYSADQSETAMQPEAVRGETDSRYSTLNGSGNIYVSPQGNEGFYALNRENSVGPQEERESRPPSSPQSPLETIGGELLEKWSDMDRNYRNYYGFDEQYEAKFSDSKVNYFQQKTMKNKYGQDNYHRPPRHLPSALVPVPESGSLSYRVPPPRAEAAPPRAEPTPPSPPATTNQKPEHHSSHSKNKIFQILPNMFKPSHKKQAAEKEKEKKKGKAPPVVIEATAKQDQHKRMSLDLEHEPEYVNMSDLPQYCMANLARDSALKKGQFVSVDNLLYKRPVFASSKDIRTLFSNVGQTFDSIHNPGSQRHSFHAMPHSYRHVNREPMGAEDMRPRASSTSATMRSPSQMQNSVESRMAVLQRKNRGQQLAPFQPSTVTSANSVGNLSNSSNNSGPSSRSRLNSSGSGSGRESKLSTLV